MEMLLFLIGIIVVSVFIAVICHRADRHRKARRYRQQFYREYHSTPTDSVENTLRENAAEIPHVTEGVQNEINNS